MAYVEDAIAIGIGPQAVKGTVDPFVLGATDLIVGAASSGFATGILLRNPDDLSKSFERIESDGGTVPGFRTRQAGAFQRTDPTLSFDIDWKGNGGTAGAPDINDFDALEYVIQLFQGARIDEGTSTTALTPYGFYTPASTEQYKTLKVWRGNRGAGTDESFTFQDCTFNLTWSYVAGEKSVLTVDVFSGPVTHVLDDTFPASPDYGTQVNAAPILESAEAEIGGVVRGFTSATLSIAYPEVEVPDSNVAGGISNEIGTPRSVEFTASWYLEAGEDDYATVIVSDTPVNVFFRLGLEAIAGGIVNAWEFDMPLFRGTTTDKVTNEVGTVERTITGYASHTSGDAELTLTAV